MLFFKNQPLEDLQAAVTGLYAYRSTSWDLAMREIKSRMENSQFVKFCNDNAFVIY